LVVAFESVREGAQQQVSKRGILLGEDTFQQCGEGQELPGEEHLVPVVVVVGEQP